MRDSQANINEATHKYTVFLKGTNIVYQLELGSLTVKAQDKCIFINHYTARFIIHPFA